MPGPVVAAGRRRPLGPPAGKAGRRGGFCVVALLPRVPLKGPAGGLEPRKEAEAGRRAPGGRAAGAAALMFMEANVRRTEGHIKELGERSSAVLRKEDRRFSCSKIASYVPTRCRNVFTTEDSTIWDKDPAYERTSTWSVIARKLFNSSRVHINVKLSPNETFDFDLTS